MTKRFLILFAFWLSFLPAFSQQSQREVVELDLTKRIKGAKYKNVEVTETGLRTKNEEHTFEDKGWVETAPMHVPLSNINEFFTFSGIFEYAHPTVGNEPGIELSWSTNGHKWTDFEKLQKDEDANPGDLKIKCALGFIDSQWKYFKLRIHCNFETYQIRGALRLSCGQIKIGNFPKKITLHFYSPGDIAAPQLRTPDTKPPTPNLLACPCPQPAFVTRTQWGCVDGQNPSCANPSFTTVTHLLVHHSAGSNTSSNWAAVVNAIWNDHVNVNGWCDIGYNWLIDPNGFIYEGRGGGDNVVGAHFCGYNSNTMGTCMMGNFTAVTPTTPAMENLRNLLAWKCCSATIDPLATSLHAGSSLTLNNISGHRNGCATSCPGDLLYAMLPQLRIDVSDYIANNCTPQIPSYDNPCTPSQLAVGTSCSFQYYSNANATNSNIPVITDLLCDGPSNGDVWFRATVPPGGQLIIDTEPGSIDDLGMAVYSGSNCSNLVYQGCYINGSSSGPWMPIAILNGLVPGSEVWIRIWEFNNNDFGTYGICAWNPCPVLPIAPVLEAVPGEICAGDSISISVISGTSGSGGAWTWYANECGVGNALGTGGNYSTSLSSTTTFYVRAEGDCGVSLCGEATVVVIPEPIAMFNFTPANLIVDFTDASSNTGSWYWDFGDGNNSTQQNPSHVYSLSGNYTVTLIVSNICGSDTSIQNIFVETMTSLTGMLSENVRVFPNPGDGTFFLQNSGESKALRITVTDAAGRTILEDRLNPDSGLYRFNVGPSAGLYFLQVSNGLQTANFKLIVH